MKDDLRRKQWFRVVVYTDGFDMETAILEPFEGSFIPVSHYPRSYKIPRFYVALSGSLAQRIEQLDVFIGMDPWYVSSPVWCLERLSDLGEWEVVFWKCGLYTPGYDAQGLRVIVVPPALRSYLLSKFCPYIAHHQLTPDNSNTQALRAGAGLGLGDDHEV